MRARRPPRKRTWPCAVPVAGRASPSNGSTTACSAAPRDLAFVQARHELGEIAGAEADVELVAQDVVPAVLAGAGRAGQREDVGAVGDARGGAALHGRGADLLEADPAERLAEPVDTFLVQPLHRLGRDVAAGDAGAAGRDHDLDPGIVDPLPHLGADLVDVVG